MRTTGSSCNGTVERECYRAWSKEEQALRRSSSGAVYYALAQNVISDGGCVFGAAFHEDGTVFLKKAQTMEEVQSLLGSKYVQARTDGAFQEVKKLLMGGWKVLFCGTPCQCNGLAAFLNGKNTENLIVVDFICHGVPSEGVWEKYLAWRSQGRKISDISFRDKRISWGDYGTKITFEDGTEYFQKHQDDPYMRLFLANRILRPSCHRCPAKGGHRTSDITLGDYWGIKGEEASRGCSVVLLNTDKGKRLLEAVADSLDLKGITYEEAVRNNVNYFQSCGIPFNRSAVFSALKRSAQTVFADPGAYTKTSFLEKVIRRGIRILRGFVKCKNKPSYLNYQGEDGQKFEIKALCCGCGACKDACPVQAISMRKDEEGFRYPVIDAGKCIHCGKCGRVCDDCKLQRRKET